MRTHKIQLVMCHKVVASPREVIENYVDYGHEVYAHGKYSRSWKRRLSKITRVRPIIHSETHHEVHIPVSLLGGLIRSVAVQQVYLTRWTGIKSDGRNVFGLESSSQWAVSANSDGASDCVVQYTFEVPWFLAFLDPFVKFAVLQLRARIWEEDRLMLERRDRLMRLGFRDGGVHP